MATNETLHSRPEVLVLVALVKRSHSSDGQLHSNYNLIEIRVGVRVRVSVRVRRLQMYVVVASSDLSRVGFLD